MPREREYECADCPPGAKHATDKTGPVPVRCPKHRAAHQSRRALAGKARRRRESVKGSLRVVGVAEDAAPTVPVLPAGDQVESVGSPAPGGVLKALRGDLERVFSQHPAAATLTSVAEVLAEVLDGPLTQADPRQAAVVSKELRGIMHELVSAKASDDDDLFRDDVGPQVVSG